MIRIAAVSESATVAHAMVQELQKQFVAGLERLAGELGSAQRFTAVEWLRDEGHHGGGVRFETGEGDMFWRGSVNVSQVHYDDSPEKKLGSAQAISTIIHPKHPLAPSVHIHISWTEMKDGSGYWRMMADLNPSNEIAADRESFLAALKAAAPAQFDVARAQGERYFYIPVLRRHRGVAHFYLEHYNSGNARADSQLAQAVGRAAIEAYLMILDKRLKTAPAPAEAQKAAQLAYHTLYFFQVLTLDRGTTTGLLAHDQNDVGIMGSLPACVDKALLASWIKRVPSPQNALLAALVAVLPNVVPSPVNDAVKRQLAEVVRQHYLAHPEAIDMQASGDTILPIG